MPTLTQPDPSTGNPPEQPADELENAAPAAEPIPPEESPQGAEQSTDTPAVENNEGANKPASLRDAIRLATGAGADSPTADKAEDPAVSAAASPESQQANPPPSGGQDAGAADEGKGDENLPFHNHPRWKEVIGERNTLRDEVTGYRDDAEGYRHIVRYMGENDLTADEVDQGFLIMAAMKGDPQKALELIEPYYRSLQLATGQVLPDELTAAVDSGEMTEETAQELSRNRAQLAQIQARQQQQEEARTRQSQELAQHEAAQAIHGAVTNWEASVAASDPDYSAIQAIVIEKIQLANMRNPARTPEQALAIAKQALADAKAQVKAFVPQRQPVVQPRAAQSAASAKPVVKSVRDAIRRATH